MQLFLTVDVEFSIGGAFADPINKRPVALPHVYCEQNGRDQGLGFLLDTLAAYDLPATFFVETNQCSYFGLQPMHEVVRHITRYGQDIQLHIHPCWSVFRHQNWPEHLNIPPVDHCGKLDPGALAQLIAEGQARFAEWGLPAATILRTGNLQTGKSVYDALRRAKLHRSSSIGIGLDPPEDSALRLYSGQHSIDGIDEWPVFSYRRPPLGETILTITGTSLGGMKSLLKRAAEAGIGQVVLLTHAFEFFDPHARRVNPVNQARLQGLCAFIATNADWLTASALGRLPDRPAQIMADQPVQLASQHLLGRLLSETVGWPKA